MEDALGGHQDVGVEMANNKNLYNLDFRDVLLCLFESAEHAQHELGKFMRAVSPHGMCFAISKFSVAIRLEISTPDGE